MRAIVRDSYAGPEQLRLAELATPEPAPREVRVRVMAVALNASDAELLTGRPAYTRLWGLFRPRFPVLGSDIAGRVDAVGSAVTRFRPGDLVFGDVFERWGGLAELALAHEDQLVLKPQALSFEQAAAIPQSGVLALQALRHGGGPQGERILLNGAGGGAGTFAIQLARHLGAAHVTVVDHAAKVEQLLSLGAERAIDYRTQDYCGDDARYDRIIDFVGSRALFDNVRVLTSRGRYLLVGGSVPRLFETLALGSLRSLLTKQRLLVFAHQQQRDDLELVARLCVEGSIRPIVGRTYDLADTPEAFRDLIDARVVGKLVLTP